MTIENAVDAKRFLVDLHQKIDHGVNPWKKVSADDWLLMKQVVAEHSFPCEPVAHGMGFGIRVYEPSQIPEIKPDVILIIDELQFPEIPNGTNKHLSKLEMMALITHTDRNKELLAWHRLPKPDDELGSYEY